MVTQEQVFEVAVKLGYNEDETQVVIDRAGSPAVALQRLKRKLASQERFVNAAHERRIADERTQRARARHEKRQARTFAERQAERDASSLSARLAGVLEAAALLAGVSAAGIAGGGAAPGKKTSKAPPPAANDLADFYMPRLKALIGNFERELDAELYGSEAAREAPEQRDLRIVRDYEGFEPHEVATFDHSVTSAKMVERARAKHGRGPLRGQIRTAA